MASHVRYTTDIPPLPAGTDAVDSFLFGTRRGYCEQISTATVVMLRSLGIPAREAVGYVPGPLQPDHRPLRHPGQGRPRLGPGLVPRLRLAELRPDRNGAGRQSRRPAPCWPRRFGRGYWPGSLVPIAAVAVAGGVVAWVFRRRSRRPATWAHQVAADLSRGGARIGCPRRPDETLTAYGLRLGRAAPDAGRRTRRRHGSRGARPPTAAIEPSGRRDQVGAPSRRIGSGRGRSIDGVVGAVRSVGSGGNGGNGVSGGNGGGSPTGAGRVRTWRGPAPRRTTLRRPAAADSPSAWPAG